MSCVQPVLSRFKLHASTVAELLQKKPVFGFNGLGEVVFRRTYSRNNETWNDVVIRVIEGTLSIRKEHFARNFLEWKDEEWQPYAREMALSLFDMEWMPPGRGLWMMGTDFAYKQGSAALNNCAAIDTKDDLVHCAEWTMDFLMNGVGVGFSTSWRGKVTLPDKTKPITHVIEDSREGWVNSLISLMCAYVDSPKYGKMEYPVFDYTQIRKEGAPIRGFGGTSSGYKPLQQLHERVDKYLTTFCDGFISVDNENSTKPYSHTRLIADIFNAIGACVVSGNVRRSAEICLGDVEDEDFINLKNYELNPERQEIGWMSNNSVILKAEQNYEDFSYIPEMAKRISANGEPGMINLYNISKFARYGKEKPDSACLVNPCGEIPLCSAEMCNLAETFPPRCANPTRFYKALEYATFYASAVSLLPTHRPETNAIVAKNRRIGVSISGIAQWVSNQSLVASEWGDMNYTKMTHYLRKGYKIVVDENARLASLAGVPASIRVTTIKPSGSISLLAGCTPGVHYPVSRFAIRRIRMSKDSPLVPVLKDAGVCCEDDTYSDNTYVFSFAIDHGNVRSSNEVSPWEQFSVVAMLQRCYSDNCVSATIYFDKEKDAGDIEKMLAMYIPILKSVSMMPHSGHGYKQAPYEPITEEQYIVLRDSYKQPEFKDVKHNVPEGSSFCASCEI